MDKQQNRAILNAHLGAIMQEEYIQIKELESIKTYANAFTPLANSQKQQVQSDLPEFPIIARPDLTTKALNGEANHAKIIPNNIPTIKPQMK